MYTQDDRARRFDTGRDYSSNRDFDRDDYNSGRGERNYGGRQTYGNGFEEREERYGARDRGDERSRGYGSDYNSSRDFDSQQRDWNDRGNRQRGYGDEYRGGYDAGQSERFDRGSNYSSGSRRGQGQYGRSDQRSGYPEHQGGYGGQGGYREASFGGPYGQTGYGYGYGYGTAQPGIGNLGSEASDFEGGAFGGARESGRRGNSAGRGNWSGSGWGGNTGTATRRNRGPKGYTRSDDRIREDLSDRLMQHDHIDPSDLEVQVRNGEVTLSGTVCCRAEKYHAEELAESIAGVKDVNNQLRVKSRDQSSSEHESHSSGSTNGGTDSSAKNKKSVSM